jgi:hypothetical protein
MKPKKRNPRIP